MDLSFFLNLKLKNYKDKNSQRGVPFSGHKVQGHTILNMIFSLILITVRTLSNTVQKFCTSVIHVGPFDLQMGNYWTV